MSAASNCTLQKNVVARLCLLLTVRLQLVLEEKDNIQEELRAIRQQLEAAPQHGQQHGDLYKQLVVSKAGSTGAAPVYPQPSDGQCPTHMLSVLQHAHMWQLLLLPPPPPLLLLLLWLVMTA